MRKAKLDNERTRRIMLSRSMSMSVIDRSGLMNEKVNDSEWAVAVTPPSSPEMEADRAMPIKRTESLVSPVMTRSTRTRALSIGLECWRSFPSFFNTITHRRLIEVCITVRPALLISGTAISSAIIHFI